MPAFWSEAFDFRGKPKEIHTQILVLRDADVQALLVEKRVTCIPLRTPPGLRQGMLAVVEGRKRKTVTLHGERYKPLVEVTDMKKAKTKDDETSRKLTLRLGLFILPRPPRDENIAA